MTLKDKELGVIVDELYYHYDIIIPRLNETDVNALSIHSENRKILRQKLSDINSKVLDDTSMSQLIYAKLLYVNFKLDYFLDLEDDDNFIIQRRKLLSKIIDIGAYREIFFDKKTSEFKSFYNYCIDIIHKYIIDKRVAKKVYKVLRNFYEERCEIYDTHTFNDMYNEITYAYNKVKQGLYLTDKDKAKNVCDIDEPYISVWGEDLADKLLDFSIKRYESDTKGIYIDRFTNYYVEKLVEFLKNTEPLDYDTAEDKAIVFFKFMLSLYIMGMKDRKTIKQYNNKHQILYQFFALDCNDLVYTWFEFINHKDWFQKVMLKFTNTLLLDLCDFFIKDTTNLLNDIKNSEDKMFISNITNSINTINRIYDYAFLNN